MKYILSKAGKETEWEDGNGSVIDTTEVAAYAAKNGYTVVGNILPPPAPETEPGDEA